MRIDAKSHIPIFQQIADQTRSAIRRGSLRAGEMLPSLRSLAVEIQVNPNTVQRAYELLEREGAVYSRKGVGVFVSDKPGVLNEANEQAALMRLSKSISHCYKAGLKAERIRAIFEQAMDDAVRQRQL
ncbi:MAG: GntR family transcriptional regulator [Planctomycetales bacterium]|nr:GntR family transcriptional regulator [Planctomycetales bacterium]